MTDLGQPSKTISALKSSAIVTRELHVDSKSRFFMPEPTAGGALSGNVTLTPAQIDTELYSADPNGASRTLTLPSAADLVSYLGAEYRVGLALPFTVINTTAGVGHDLTLVLGTGGSSVGAAAGGLQVLDFANIPPGAGHFKIRLDSATAYTVYRIA